MSDGSTAPSDEELLAAYLSGDADAFGQLLTRYRRPLFNFILRTVRDPVVAEDLTQDVFVRIVRRASDFKGSSKFTTWMYTIARNICIDHGRRMSHRRHRSLDASVPGAESGAPLVERIASDAPGVDRAAASEGLRGQIAAAVEALPDDQREVFLLRQVEGMRFREIAEVVGVPENTVKSRMRYALERLTEALEEHRDYARKPA